MIKEEAMSGREEVLGFSFSDFSKKKAGLLKKTALRKKAAVPSWFARFHGDGMTWEQALSGEPEVLGSFLPGLMKPLKKAVKAIGKFTAPITTKIAKTFLPSSLVDAAAHLDPTKKGNITPGAIAAIKSLLQSKAAESQAVSSDTAIKTQAAAKTLLNPMVLGIAGAGVLALILLRKKGR